MTNHSEAADMSGDSYISGRGRHGETARATRRAGAADGARTMGATCPVGTR